MLKLFNTLTGKKEEFESIEPSKVGMYNCGPTVYNYAHIGNLRAYVFADVLRRTFEYNGYEVKQVMNITDVGHLSSEGDDGDDKMVKALRREGKPFTMEAMREVGDFYTKAFVEDLKAINCLLPHHMPKASENIPEDVEIVKKLEEKGFAYRTSDGIYYDISKFSEYGKLGNIKREGQLAGARVVVNSEKRNPADFCLWKFSNSEMGWESPWGKGFPGWHIECSGMSRRYLGQPFDIHTGGIDHIPVHHNNEIAQSEAAFGVPLANYWMHNAHLNMGSEKMAKSGEGFVTLNNVNLAGILPLAYRYSLLTARYSTSMRFSVEAVKGMQSAFNSFVEAFNNLGDDIGIVNKGYVSKFLEAVNDDLNTPVALSLAWGLLNDNTVSARDKKATMIDFDRVFGFGLNENSYKKSKPVEVPEIVQKLCAERQIARASRDWKKSDELRLQIESYGYRVKDSENETIVEPI